MDNGGKDTEKLLAQFVTPQDAANALGREYRYENEDLGEVVTMPEATILFRKSRSSLYFAWWTRKIDGRKSISGGTLLFTMASLIREYGAPKNDILQHLFDEPITQEK